MKAAVKDVMTTRVTWVRKDATFREMAAALRNHRVSAFPVLGDGDKVIGVVSEADVLSVFDRPDGEICEEINGLLRNSFLIDPRAFDVTVKRGVVTLAGVPETSEVGHEIVLRARHVQGVVAVRDRLRYPRPERDEPHFDVLANFPMD